MWVGFFHAVYVVNFSPRYPRGLFRPSLPNEREHIQMMLKIACPCGYVGLINAETLPRDLVCSHCGASRRIERKDGARIVNRVAFEEWLRGEHKAPS